MAAQHVLRAVRGTLSATRPLLAPATAPARMLPASLQVHKRQTSSFLNGTATSYTEAMYESWKEDPTSVHVSWRAYFEAEQQGLDYQSPPTLGSSPHHAARPTYTFPSGYTAAPAAPVAAQGQVSYQEITDHLKVENLIRAYQTRGHNVASLDPLGIFHADLDADTPPEITLEYYGLTEADLDRTFTIAENPLFEESSSPMTLRSVIARLEDVFCKTIGYEFMHIQEKEKRNWLMRTVSRSKGKTEPKVQRVILDGLVEAHGFEAFLQKKFPSEKRFGLDGCEALIPGLQRLIERASELGAEHIVFGMPHRGRLNVLANVMQKPLRQIFKEFNSTLDPEDEGSGDVKYHLGMSSDVHCNSTSRPIHLSLMANPSHLEAVNPLVEGKARAEQDYREDPDRKKTIPVLLHGDAAFAGQGVVFETISMTELPDYTSGGTVHVVVNNQIGFTTDPRVARSTDYCTDVAKMVGAPILHVNADDPEAVISCFDTAMEWRQNFGSDVVIDMVCYRRYGHNEADQPLFTQPLMYKRIAKQTPVIRQYSDELKKQGVLSDSEFKQLTDAYEARASEAFETADQYVQPREKYLTSFWKDFLTKVENAKIMNTGTAESTLKTVGQHCSTVPDTFTTHRAVAKILKTRAQSIEAGKDLDWATGELLAFGSLLLEGTHVRLSGQDVERGTFSQRHHVLHDQEVDGSRYVALQNLASGQGNYTVCNSHLSEYGVLGFELGYSQSNPNSLVCWEAQFGDFANTAQCIIDQFISSGESKWRRQIGLTMLLPHGYEGMGPEHSSARLERFLQMCDDDEDTYPENMNHFARTQIEEANWQVVYPTTPANYFHVLRRQVHREFRKPLIVMTPKSLLRHPLARSSLDELTGDTRFKRFIPELNEDIFKEGEHAEVRRLVLCSGKVYYDLVQERDSRGITDVAIARVEQISPFPFDLVHMHADNFPNAEVVWCQEEPKNMGAWTYVKPRIEASLDKTTHHSGTRPRYIGRVASSSTATGDKNAHKEQQQQLVNDSLA
eukprot:m.481673 g.481673  ORF g.481673 m.481673 type:complete len:1016 (-) comp22278_c0_seq1:65-3112(-)